MKKKIIVLTISQKSKCIYLLIGKVNIKKLNECNFIS